MREYVEYEQPMMMATVQLPGTMVYSMTPGPMMHLVLSTLLPLGTTAQSWAVSLCCTTQQLSAPGAA